MLCCPAQCFAHLVLLDFQAHLVTQGYPSLLLHLDAHTLGYLGGQGVLEAQSGLDLHLDHVHL